VQNNLSPVSLAFPTQRSIFKAAIKQFYGSGHWRNRGIKTGMRKIAKEKQKNWRGK